MGGVRVRRRLLGGRGGGGVVGIGKWILNGMLEGIIRRGLLVVGILGNNGDLWFLLIDGAFADGLLGIGWRVLLADFV